MSPPPSLRAGCIVRGPTLPEPVEVLAVVPLGDSLKIIGCGLRTGLTHEPVLTPAQLAQLSVSKEHRLQAGATQQQQQPGATQQLPDAPQDLGDASQDLGGTGFQPVTGTTLTRRNLPHIQKPGHAYHVVFRTRDIQLPEVARRVAFDACLYWNAKKADVHACVVMPDHVHLLLTPKPRQTSQRVLACLKSSIASRASRPTRSTRS